MEFTLQAMETAALAPQCAMRVRCSAGTLWITGERGGDDVVLGAGESALLAPGEQHYLSALGRATRTPAAFEIVAA